MSFLRLNEWLERAAAARLSRRGTLAATATGLLTPLLRNAGQAAPRHAVAAAVPPPPPPPGDNWPVCESPEQHYCVSVLTVDGVDQLTESNPAYTPWVVGNPATSGGSVYGELQWQVMRLNGLQAEDQARAIVLAIRAGSIPEPVSTWLWLRDARMRVTGDAASGRTWEIRGYPASVPVTDPPMPGGAQAAEVWTQCEGSSFLRGAPVLDHVSAFEGYIAGSNINTLGTPLWNGSGWQLMVASPHLMPDGSVTHGSYLNWVSPASLQRMGLTPEQAIAGDLVVTRTDDGVVSPVTAAMSIIDGGALIDVRDLTFSSPTISITRRGRGGCAVKCKKRRICKNGRCVKKKH